MWSESTWLRARLSILMFFQFFVWASWSVPIGTYGPMSLGLTGGEMGWIFSTTAIAAIVSPLFVGYVADRLFATQHVLAALHVIGGVCMILAGFSGSFGFLFAFLLISTLAFMPTLALANSLTFRNIEDSALFPRIALFGTIGWIVSGFIVGIVLGERSPAFLYLAGLIELLLAGYVLTLPHTPPQKKEDAGKGDFLGLSALQLLRDPEFLLFTVCAFLIGIPAVYYFVSCNLYLSQINAPAPTAVMTLGQVGEILVMAAMPVFIARFGLKKVLAVGMIVWAIRYLLFATLNFPITILAISIHGFCYVFVYVGAYIFVDTKAPRDMRASAQSFISFLMLGVAWLLGANLAGKTNDLYPPKISAVTAELIRTEAIPADYKVPAWNELLAKYDGNKDGALEEDEFRAGTVEEKDAERTARRQAEALLGKISALSPPRTRAAIRAAVNGKFHVTAEDYAAIQRNDWQNIWLWPAIASLLVAVIFYLGIQERKDGNEGGASRSGEAAPAPGEAPPAAPQQPETQQQQPERQPPPLTQTQQQPPETPPAPDEAGPPA
ncbi:MAG: nucleoside permease [Thermogutta sp.]|nr:nucleoside permease [Thermogutta sp.]